MTTFDTYCGLSCEKCEFRESMHCGGCIATQGKPFHGHCDVAECACKKQRRFCGECADFPCDTLKRYSFDKEHGDNGQRIESCKAIKAALVAQAREGVDPIAYCGFYCDSCFLGQWCGSCRSDYNCCSFATICEGGVCPQVACCQSRGYDGCWQCDELETCSKGYFQNEQKGEYACKAQALFVRARGKQALIKALQAIARESENTSQYLDKQGSVNAALAALQRKESEKMQK